MDEPSLVPAWINKKGKPLTPASKPLGDRDTFPSLERNGFHPSKQPPARPAPWGASSSNKPTRNVPEPLAAQRSTKRDALPVRVQDLLPADPLAVRLDAASRTASVPAPSNSGGTKVSFDAEFPSLKDSGPSAARSSTLEPAPAQPVSKQAPYKPSYLTDRVTSNWTSKLAEAPSLPTGQARPTSPPAVPVSAPGPSAALSSEPAPAQPTVTHGVPSHAPQGWGSTASGGPGADTVKNKLLETLPGSNGANGQHGAAQDPDSFRAQLAVRQSKQLIPVLARKDGSSGSTSATNLSKQPSTSLLPGRNSLMGSVALLRQASAGPERTPAPVMASAAVQGDVSADGKLTLRPLTRKGSQSTHAHAPNGEAPEPGQRTLSGMVPLCRSPPPVINKAVNLSASSKASSTTPVASAAPVSVSESRPQVAQLPPVTQPAVAQDDAKQDVRDQAVTHATSAATKAPPVTVQLNTPTAAAHSLDTPATAVPAPAKVPTNSAAGLPAEEVAFLVSLGWTGEDDSDDDDGHALTEEEIAAFRAASAHLGGSRCSTPQLRFSEPATRTQSPAPYSQGFPAANGLYSPGYTNGYGLRASTGAVTCELGLPSLQVKPTSTGTRSVSGILEVEPLFPGVSPGWFGALGVGVTTLSSGSPQSHRGSSGSQDGLRP